MRIFRHDTSRPDRKKLTTPLIISIILHILLLLLLLNKDILQKETRTAKNQEKDYIEISEIPVPEKKETESPEKPSVLAERSHKAEKESTIDDTTRLAKQPPPKNVPPPSPPQKDLQAKKQQKPPEESSEPEEKKKTPDKKVVKKEPEKQKQVLETARKEPEGLQEKQTKESTKKEDTGEKKVASLPKKTLEPKQEKPEKDLSDIGEKLMRSRPLQPSVPDAPQSNKSPMYGADVPQKEDTVDLSTKEFKYVSYFTNLKRKIDGVWNYPEESQMRGETGRLFLIFTLNSNGELEDIKLVDSSGYERLDREALRAIKVASPYNPFPDSWEVEKLNIRASFEYRYSRFIR